MNSTDFSRNIMSRYLDVSGLTLPPAEIFFLHPAEPELPEAVSEQLSILKLSVNFYHNLYLQHNHAFAHSNFFMQHRQEKLDRMYSGLVQNSRDLIGDTADRQNVEKHYHTTTNLWQMVRGMSVAEAVIGKAFRGDVSPVQYLPAGTEYLRYEATPPLTPMPEKFAVEATTKQNKTIFQHSETHRSFPVWNPLALPGASTPIRQDGAFYQGAQPNVFFAQLNNQLNINHSEIQLSYASDQADMSSPAKAQTKQPDSIFHTDFVARDHYFFHQDRYWQNIYNNQSFTSYLNQRNNLFADERNMLAVHLSKAQTIYAASATEPREAVDPRSTMPQNSGNHRFDISRLTVRETITGGQYQTIINNTSNRNAIYISRFPAAQSGGIYSPHRYGQAEAPMENRFTPQAERTAHTGQPFAHREPPPPASKIFHTFSTPAESTNSFSAFPGRAVNIAHIAQNNYAYAANAVSSNRTLITNITKSGSTTNISAIQGNQTYAENTLSSNQTSITNMVKGGSITNMRAVQENYASTSNMVQNNAAYNMGVALSSHAAITRLTQNHHVYNTSITQGDERTPMAVNRNAQSNPPPRPFSGAESRMISIFHHELQQNSVTTHLHKNTPDAALPAQSPLPVILSGVGAEISHRKRQDKPDAKSAPASGRTTNTTTQTTDIVTKTVQKTSETTDEKETRPAITPREIEQMVPIDKITDKVYKALEMRLRSERIKRGMPG